MENYFLFGNGFAFLTVTNDGELYCQKDTVYRPVAKLDMSVGGPKTP